MRHQHIVRSSILATLLLTLIPTALLVAGDPARADAPPVAADNLVGNPSFETTPTEWTAYNSTLTTVVDASSPDATDPTSRTVAVVQPTARYDNYSIYSSSDRPTSAAGKTYYASVWVKGDATSAGQLIALTLSAQMDVAPWTVVAAEQTKAVLTTSWQKLEVALKAPQSGLKISMAIGRPLHSQKWATTDSFRVDGAYLTEKISTGTRTTNPSFETNPSEWGCWHSTLSSVADAAAPSGTNVLRVAHSGCNALTTTEGFVAGQSVGAFPQGSTATASVWVRAETADMVGRTASLRLREYDGSTAVQEQSADVTLTSGWQQVSLTGFTSTGGANGTSSMYVDISAVGPANAVFRADAFSVVTTPAATAPVANLIANSSFETNTSGWTCLGSTLSVLTAADAPAGSKVGRVTQSTACPTGTGAGPGGRVTFTARKGFTYSVRLSAKAGTGTSGDVLTATASDGTTLATATVGLGSTYKSLALPPFVARADGPVTVQVKTPNGAAGDFFLLDNVTASGAWSSDFAGTAGAAPDASTWTAQDLAHIRQACFEPSQAELDGAGSLRLRLDRGDCPGWAWDPNEEEEPASPFMGANVFTQGKVSFKPYGTYEARIRSNSDADGWPAFWLLPEESPSTWPDGGEIDVTDNLEWSGVIGPGDPVACPLDDDTTPAWEGAGIDYGERYGCNFTNRESDGRGESVTYYGDDTWHTYRMDWTPQRFVFFVDGQPVSAIRAADYQAWAGKAWPFDNQAVRWYLILTLNSHTADATRLPNGDEILVDWVRVSQLP